MRHNPNKTDKSNGFLLSDLNMVGYLPEVWLAPEEVQDLRAMVRYRKQLVEQRKEVKLRIRAILRQHRIKKHLRSDVGGPKVLLPGWENFRHFPLIHSGFYGNTWVGTSASLQL
jgi:hypothetical protein